MKIKDKLKTVERKIVEHRDLYFYSTGAIAGAGVTYLVMRRIPQGIPNIEICTQQTSAEIAEMLKKTRAIDITSPKTGKQIVLFASDYLNDQ